MSSQPTNHYILSQLKNVLDDPAYRTDKRATNATIRDFIQNVLAPHCGNSDQVDWSIFSEAFRMTCLTENAYAYPLFLEICVNVKQDIKTFFLTACHTLVINNRISPNSVAHGKLMGLISCMGGEVTDTKAKAPKMHGDIMYMFDSMSSGHTGPSSQALARSSAGRGGYGGGYSNELVGGNELVTLLLKMDRQLNRHESRLESHADQLKVQKEELGGLTALLAQNAEESKKRKADKALTEAQRAEEKKARKLQEATQKKTDDDEKDKRFQAMIDQSMAKTVRALIASQRQEREAQEAPATDSDDDKSVANLKPAAKGKSHKKKGQ